MPDSSSFDKRTRAFEADFARKEEREFRLLVLRNQKLGAWAAKMIGLSGEKAKNYANDLIAVSVGEAGEDAIFNKISRDFDANQVDYPAREIRRMMEDFLTQAQTDIQQTEENDDE